MAACHFADVHCTVTYAQKDTIKENRGEQTAAMIVSYTRAHTHMHNYTQLTGS